MTKMAIDDAEDAVCGLGALRAAMTNDLEDVEHWIHANAGFAADDSVILADQPVYELMRASLYSGLACINELLGWVKLLAEKDQHGEMSDLVKALPMVPVFTVH